MSGFNAPSDSSIANSIVNGVNQIRLTQYLFTMHCTRYLEEIARGVAYGTQDSRFTDSQLLNITPANVESYAQEHIQCLQTLIANKNLLTASGTENAIVLQTRTIDNSLYSGEYAQNAPLPLNFRNGLELDFVAIADNTGAVTISILNFQGVNGVLNLVKQDFSALTSGDIKTGYRYTIICDSTNNRFILKDAFVRQASAIAPGIAYLNKPITIANNSTDSNNDIDFSAGNFTFSDYSGVAVLSALTKRLDASWTAGTNQGGLDTGIKANSTWYHCYAIHNPTSGVSDAIFSKNATTPSLPTGYTKYDYIASFLTNTSGNIIVGNYDFDRVGSYTFKYNLAKKDFDGTFSTNVIPYTLSTPLGLNTNALVNIYINSDNTSSLGVYGYFYEFFKDIVNASSSNFNVIAGNFGSYQFFQNAPLEITTNLLSQIRGVVNTSPIKGIILTVGFKYTKK